MSSAASAPPAESSAPPAESSAPRPEPSPLAPAAPTPAWSPARRVAFRFLFAYLVQIALPFPLAELPGAEWLGSLCANAWASLVLWVARHLLGITREISTAPTGSGDTAFHWTSHLTMLALAVIATVAWTLADRRRRRYARLQDWLRAYLRLFLGGVMLSYGLAKVIATQFPPPSLERLFHTYGDSSPMGLLWTFMGSSTAYSTFGGALEVLGGALVLGRRTTTLGALVVAGVMSNVVMLNFSYDVPVKLFSTHLLLIAVYLLGPDLGRLASLLVLHRPTTPAPLGQLFARRRLNRIALALKLLVVGYLVFANASANLALRTKLSDRPPLYGAYAVEAHSRDGQPVPPSPTEATDDPPWRRFFVDRFQMVAIQTADDRSVRFRAEFDETQHTLTLSSPSTPDKRSLLNYHVPDPSHLAIDGTFAGAAVGVKLRKIDLTKLELTGRGFHWVSEVPYNR